jgi:Zn-dependent alcohol dehydrogenase
MKAAILVKNKFPLLVTDIDLPSNLDFGQILVKILYSSICGAQINEIDCIKGKDKFLPHLLGHEGSGIVLDIGKGVKNVKVGDHVVLHWRKGEGIQSEPPKYLWKGKTVNAGWVTTFNDQAIVSENRLTKIPKNFNLRLAPLFGCAITTAIGVVNNDAQIKIGQSVIIFGLGGLGLSIAKISELVSANPIIGVDVNTKKIKIAKKNRLRNIFLNDKKNFKNKLKKLLNNGKADIVIDTTGNTKVIEQCYELTESNGKTILCGVPKKSKNISIHTLPLHFNKVLKGSHGGDSNPSEDIPRFIRLMKDKKINIKNLITHQFKLEEINKAIKIVRKGIAGRVLIDMR